ncbi:hypothetical protein C8R47DRAFT_1108864 [Mycena vitilis]|nr:hypothetical protein C8R47DRAFT_1108864 [Mycena vitilis]
MWSIFVILFGGLTAIIGVGYFVAHCILGNILGHAIFAIAEPDIYAHTLQSAVFSTLYGSLVIIGGLMGLAQVLTAIRLAISDGDDEDESLLQHTMLWLAVIWEFLAIPLGVVINVVGVLLLKRHGYQGPLPTLQQAACVGAVGQALSGAMHLWRVGFSFCAPL